MLQVIFYPAIIYPLTIVGVLMGTTYHFGLIMLFMSFCIYGDAYLKPLQSHLTISKVIRVAGLLSHVVYIPILMFCFFARISAPANELLNTLLDGVEISVPLVSSWFEYLVLILAFGLALSMCYVVGHELIHRLHSKFLRSSGKLLLAFAGDAQMSISHVFGHHRNIGLANDPATARKDEDVYRFFLRSFIGQYLESIRLSKYNKQKGIVYSMFLRDEYLECVLLQCVVFASIVMFFGFTAFCVYLLGALVAKFMFETINYIQHYGLERNR